MSPPSPASTVCCCSLPCLQQAGYSTLIPSTGCTGLGIFILAPGSGRISAPPPAAYGSCLFGWMFLTLPKFFWSICAAQTHSTLPPADRGSGTLPAPARCAFVTPRLPLSQPGALARPSATSLECWGQGFCFPNLSVLESGRCRTVSVICVTRCSQCSARSWLLSKADEQNSVTFRDSRTAVNSDTSPKAEPGHPACSAPQGSDNPHF